MSTNYTPTDGASLCSGLADIREAVAMTDEAVALLELFRRLERKRLETFVRLHPSMAVAEMSRLIGRSRPTIDKTIKDVYR